MSQSLDLLKLLTKDYSMGSSHKLKRKRKRWSWRKRGYYAMATAVDMVAIPTMSP